VEDVKKKTLILETTALLHSQIKQRAAVRNISIKKWVLQAIIEKMKQEDHYK